MAPPLDTILTGDCIELLGSLPERSVDLVFADPPYNLQLTQELHRPDQSKVDAVDDAWDQFASFQEYDRFTRAWLTACRRVLKDTGTLWVIGTYHNIHRVGAILQDVGYWILNDVAWVKTNPMPQFRGVRFCNAHETLIWAKRSPAARGYTFNYHSLKLGNEDLQARSDWYLPLCSGGERLRKNGEKLHATQKPEALLWRVLSACTGPADVVLDPFFGTGTTGAVAKRLGRHYIGIEQDEAYVQAARARIAATEPALLDSLDVVNPRAAARVPFALLLELGLIAPGDTLRLGRTQHVAEVQADGSLRSGEVRGSIHSVGAKVLHTPACNGWEAWRYRDIATGELRILDDLRRRARALMARPAEPPLPEESDDATEPEPQQ